MSTDTPPIEIEATASLITPVDTTLQQEFAKDVAAQATRMDDLAKQLVTLGIAVPGIYAALLKLINGAKATVDDPVFLLLAFIAWLLALGLALVSLFPERQAVDQDSLTEIQAYFTRAARRKFKLLVAASLLQFFGICLAVLSLLI